MKTFIQLSLLAFLLYSCNISNEKNKLNPKIAVNTEAEKNMPYLNIKESSLKSLDVKTNLLNKQIAYSAYKRATKFIDHDSITLKMVYKIESGEQINISPLLQDFIEGIIYFSNKEIEEALEKNPGLKKRLLTSKQVVFSGEQRQKEFTNKEIPSWAKAYKIIQDYRKIKK